MRSIYTPDGWLDIPAIRSLGAWCHVIIGPRQVGKTYGVLKDLLESDRYFIFSRRTGTELDRCATNPDYDPFIPLEKEGYKTAFFKQGDTYSIADYSVEYKDADDEIGKRVINKRRGAALSLYQIAGIKGFSGRRFTDWVFDEFIPEKIVVTRADEGGGFYNGYTTICGNRELEGEQPLICWLLSNAARIDSPILAELGLVNEVSRMIRKGEEYKMLSSGVFVALPKSQQVIEKRQETAMARHMAKYNPKSKAYRVAMQNEFAYDNLDLVKPKSLAGYSPLLSCGGIYIWDNGTSAYACRSRHNSRNRYKDTPEQRVICQAENPEIRQLFNYGLLTFDAVETMLDFLAYFDIKR